MGTDLFQHQQIRSLDFDDFDSNPELSKDSNSEQRQNQQQKPGSPQEFRREARQNFNQDPRFDLNSEFRADHQKESRRATQPEPKSIQNFPRPDEIPARADLSHIPKDILKSSTVENLISQNEDLMARLKVALRRLSILENENQHLSDESSQIRLAQTSVSDQMLILKEKDNVWKKKLDTIEREKEIQYEKLMALEKKAETMASEISRHEKYHEQIKNQVKPYITQLKDYSKTQEIKIKNLEENLSIKEAQLRDIRNQIVDMTQSYQTQIETTEKKSTEMISHYESHIEHMNQQVLTLTHSQEELEIKTVKLNAALARQDSLENEIITIQRSKLELKERLDEEIRRIQERQSELMVQNRKLGVEHADLQIRVVEDQEKIRKVESENKQLLEQLESLRFMWNAKNEENEKFKAASAALERINLELSQKLNEIRKESN